MCLSIYLSIYLSNLFVPAEVPQYLSIYLISSIYLSIYLNRYLSGPAEVPEYLGPLHAQEQDARDVAQLQGYHELALSTNLLQLTKIMNVCTAVKDHVCMY